MHRISFISTLAFNYFFPGTIREAGGHTRFYNISRKFAEKKEYSVSCIVGDFGQPDIVEKDGVKIVKAPLDNPLAFFKVLKILSKLKSDIYVDFCASPRLFLLYVLRKMLSARYVFFTAHDNDVNGEYLHVENPFYYWAYILGLKNADTIVSQVPYHVKMLSEKYNLSSQLVLSPYFDIKPLDPSGFKKKHILWVGRAADYKNPHLFLELSKKLPGESFVMICNKSGYDGGFFKNIKREICSLNNFTFLDYVSYPEMKQYFSEAKLLVNTSKYEGFSNTFIEAAMNHTPVVSLNSDPNEMLTAYKAGIFCNGNRQKLLHSVSKIASSGSLQKRFGKNAYEYANNHHQIDDAVKKIDNIFKKLLRADSKN